MILKARSTDAVLLAVAALTKVNRAIREWDDVDGNSMDAMRVADFVIEEHENGYDCATNPHETTSPAARIQARAAAVIRPLIGITGAAGSPLRREPCRCRQTFRDGKPSVVARNSYGRRRGCLRSSGSTAFPGSSSVFASPLGAFPPAALCACEIEFPGLWPDERSNGRDGWRPPSTVLAKTSAGSAEPLGRAARFGAQFLYFL